MILLRFACWVESIAERVAAWIAEPFRQFCWEVEQMKRRSIELEEDSKRILELTRATFRELAALRREMGHYDPKAVKAGFSRYYDTDNGWGDL